MAPCRGDSGAEAAFSRRLPRVGVLSVSRGSGVVDRARRRRARDRRSVGLRGCARRPLRRERAVPPHHVVSPGQGVDAPARPLDDLRLHRRHLHAVCAAGDRGLARLGGAHRRVGRCGRRDAPLARLDRCAEVAGRDRLSRARLGRRAGGPAAVLGRRGGGGDTGRRSAAFSTPSARSRMRRSVRIAGREPSATTSSSTSSWSPQPRCSSSRSRSWSPERQPR